MIATTLKNNNNNNNNNLIVITSTGKWGFSFGNIWAFEEFISQKKNFEQPKLPNSLLSLGPPHYLHSRQFQLPHI